MGFSTLGAMSVAQSNDPSRRRHALLAAGVALAAAAALAAPSSPLLPGPDTRLEEAVTWLALSVAFAAGVAFWRAGIYLLIAAIMLEGAVRKWIANDIAIFMVKDFFLLGVYAAVLPTLRRAELRRPWWLLAPLAALVALALVHVARTDGVEQAAIGLRSYVLYVPLLWVAPKLLPRTRQWVALAVAIVVVGAAESVLGAIQTLTGGDFINRLTTGTLPALVTHGNVAYLRPTGTFLQVGTFTAFMFFPVVVVLAAVAWAPRNRVLWSLLALTVLGTWGVMLGASRALTWTSVAAAVGFLAIALARRRFLPVALLALAVVVGITLFRNLPLGDDEFERNVTYTYIDREGKVTEQTVSIGSGNAAAVSRASVDKGRRTDATDFVGGGMPHNRIDEQLRVITSQGLVGHGTGTMTLGSGYVAAQKGALAGEGMYSKVAWELAWPGLVAFCLFLAAMFVAALRGAVRTRGPAERWLASLAVAVAVLVPGWSVLVFALDYPIVASLYYSFVGYAVAQDAAEG